MAGWPLGLGGWTWEHGLVTTMLGCYSVAQKCYSQGTWQEVSYMALIAWQDFFFFLRSKTYKISRNRLEETDKDVSVELEIHPK